MQEHERNSYVFSITPAMWRSTFCIRLPDFDEIALFLYPFSWSRMWGASRMQIDHFLYKNIYGLGVRFISFPSISFMRRCVKQRQIQRCEDVTGCKLLVGVSAGIIWRCRHSMWCRTYFFVTLCRFSLSRVWKHIIRYNCKFSWNHCQFELRDSQWVKFLSWNV